MRWRAASILATSLRCRSPARSSIARSVSEDGVGEVGMVLAGVLEILQGLLGHLEDVLPPIEQLQPKVLPLALVHERLAVRRPIDFVDGPDTFAVFP